MQIRLHLMPVAEGDDVYIAGCLQQFPIILPVGFAKGDYVFVQGVFLLIKKLRAVAAHIVSGCAVILKNAFGNPPEARNCWKIEEKDRIAVLQSMG